MNNLQSIFLCCRINYKKWSKNPRIYTIWIIILIFQYYSFSTLPPICEYYGISATPWVFPFFMGSPAFFIIYGALAMTLYCDAPFTDGHTPFLLVRTGRRNWIIGQLLYVYSSSFLYTLSHVVVSILVISPTLTFSWDWGTMLRTLVNNPELFEYVGVRKSFFPYKEFLEAFSPIQAMGLSILLFWLGTAFLGILILCFHIMIGNMSGLVISGILTSLAYFTCYLGALSFGERLRFFSPITWSCISYLMDWSRTGTTPSVRFAITSYLIMMGIMSVISVILFCRKDVMIQDEEQ